MSSFPFVGRDLHSVTGSLAATNLRLVTSRFLLYLLTDIFIYLVVPGLIYGMIRCATLTNLNFSWLGSETLYFVTLVHSWIFQSEIVSGRVYDSEMHPDEWRQGRNWENSDVGTTLAVPVLAFTTTISSLNVLATCEFGFVIDADALSKSCIHFSRMAGTDTTSISITYLFWELSRHPGSRGVYTASALVGM